MWAANERVTSRQNTRSIVVARYVYSLVNCFTVINIKIKQNFPQQNPQYSSQTPCNVQKEGEKDIIFFGLPRAGGQRHGCPLICCRRCPSQSGQARHGGGCAKGCPKGRDKSANPIFHRPASCISALLCNKWSLKNQMRWREAERERQRDRKKKKYIQSWLVTEMLLEYKMR